MQPALRALILKLDAVTSCLVLTVSVLAQLQRVRLVKLFVVPCYVIFLVKLVGDQIPLLFAPGKLNGQEGKPQT